MKSALETTLFYPQIRQDIEVRHIVCTVGVSPHELIDGVLPQPVLHDRRR